MDKQTKSELMDQAKSSSNQTITIKKETVKLLAVAGIVIISLAAFLLKKYIIVAWVNGAPITRTTYDQTVQRTGGGEILDQLIVEQLIRQKAEKDGVVVNPAMIETEIDKIRQSLETQNTTLDQALALQGMTETDLRDQITINQLLSDLAPVESSISAEELSEYAATNLPDVDLAAEENQDLANQIRQQLTTQKRQQAITDYISSLKTEATITTWL